MGHLPDGTSNAAWRKVGLIGWQVLQNLQPVEYSKFNIIIIITHCTVVGNNNINCT